MHQSFSASPMKDCSCFPSVSKHQLFLLPFFLRLLQFVVGEEFTNDLLTRKKVSFLFPFSAVNSSSNPKSRKLGMATILLVKTLVLWLWLFYL